MPQRDSSAPSRKALAALLLAVVSLAGALGYIASRWDDRGAPAKTPRNPGPFRGNILPDQIKGKRAPTFRLPDARGGTYGTSDARGKPYVVTFLYANCPDVCPLIGQELRQTVKLLGGRGDDVSVLAVSVDPKGDTAETVRGWLRRQRLPSNFHYLIGAERQLKPVWDDYFAAPQIPGRADSAHSASIWLIDAQGRIATKYSGGFPVSPADIAHDLRLLLRRRDRRAAGLSNAAG